MVTLEAIPTMALMVSAFRFAVPGVACARGVCVNCSVVVQVSHRPTRRGRRACRAACELLAGMLRGAASGMDRAEIDDRELALLLKRASRGFEFPGGVRVHYVSVKLTN